MFFCDDSLRFHLFRHLAFWELTVCQFEDLASHILQAASIQRVAPLFLLCHNLTCVGRKTLISAYSTSSTCCEVNSTFRNLIAANLNKFHHTKQGQAYKFSGMNAATGATYIHVQHASMRDAALQVTGMSCCELEA